MSGPVVIIPHKREPPEEFTKSSLFRNEWTVTTRNWRTLLLEAGSAIFFFFLLLAKFYSFLHDFMDWFSALLLSAVIVAVIFIPIIVMHSLFLAKHSMFLASIDNPEAKHLPVEDWIRRFLNGKGYIFDETSTAFLIYRLTSFKLATGERVEVLKGPQISVRIGPKNELNSRRLDELKIGISKSISDEFRKRALGFLYPVVGDKEN